MKSYTSLGNQGTSVNSYDSNQVQNVNKSNLSRWHLLCEIICTLKNFITLLPRT